MSKLPGRYIYPAVFHFDDDGVSVVFPDLDGCFTGGSDLEEAYRLARDVLAGYLSLCEEDGVDIPAPTIDREIEHENNERVMLVEVWMPPYRENYADRSVNKTVTLPRWLKNAAEERKINFSRVLQDALMEHLGIQVPRTHDPDHLINTSDGTPIVNGYDEDEVTIDRTTRRQKTIARIVSGTATTKIGLGRVGDIGQITKVPQEPGTVYAIDIGGKLYLVSVPKMRKGKVKTSPKRYFARH